MRQVSCPLRSRANTGEPFESHRCGEMRKMPETNGQNPLTGNRSRIMRWRQQFKLAILVVGCTAITITVFLGSHVRALSNDSALAPASTGYELTEAQEQGRDFSKFSHT